MKKIRLKHQRINMIILLFTMSFITWACSKSENSFSREVAEIITPTAIAAKVEVEREALQVNVINGESKHTNIKDDIKGVVENVISNPHSIDEEMAIMLVEGNFEEKENRNFELTSTEIINEIKYYIITVTGKAESMNYPMDVFAINSVADDEYSIMYYDKEKMDYVEFFGTPWFACKTSPDGKLRMESIGMYMDGPSGLHALKEIRLYDIKTGDVLWSGESLLLNNFIWSPDSRYVSVQQGGRTWISSMVIDTEDMSIIKLPEAEEILLFNAKKPKPLEGYTEFRASEWINNTKVSVDFKWSTELGDEVQGKYEYDVLTHEMDIK